MAPLRIVAGLHRLSVMGEKVQSRLTPTVLIHADYTGGVAPFDIALLGPETPLVLEAGLIETIRIPQPNVIPTGQIRLFGWGSTSMTDTPVIPDVLQTVAKPVLSLEMCREVLDSKFPEGTPLHSTNVCTGPLETEVTACSGDSGGPIVQPGAGGTVS